MMRNLGGAVGIAICGAILNNRINFHFERIASTLTSGNAAMQTLLDGTQARFGQAFGDTAHAAGATLLQLRGLAYREASTMAYADAFLAVGVAFAIAVVLVPLLRKVAPPPPQQQPSGDAGH
jgi:DHA2 family multidrug resistance protein